MKDMICTAVGIAGSAIASCFGGWDAGLKTLVVFLALDYITGLVVAGLFHNSPHSSTGGLESRAGWKGLVRKCATLALVLAAHYLDLILGLDKDYIRNMVIIGFVTNEFISLVENAGLMGLPLPNAVLKAIDILKEKAGEAEAEEEPANE